MRKRSQRLESPTGVALSGSRQCDQIGRFLKVIGIFHAKVAQNIW